MSLKDAADHHGGRILVALLQEVLCHLQEVRKDPSMNQLRDANEVASYYISPKRLGDSEKDRYVARPV
jgi:hypothetical protein